MILETFICRTPVRYTIYQSWQTKYRFTSRIRKRILFFSSCIISSTGFLLRSIQCSSNFIRFLLTKLLRSLKFVASMFQTHCVLLLVLIFSCCNLIHSANVNAVSSHYPTLNYSSGNNISDLIRNADQKPPGEKHSNGGSVKVLVILISVGAVLLSIGIAILFYYFS